MFVKKGVNYVHDVYVIIMWFTPLGWKPEFFNWNYVVFLVETILFKKLHITRVVCYIYAENVRVQLCFSPA